MRMRGSVLGTAVLLAALPLAAPAHASYPDPGPGFVCSLDGTTDPTADYQTGVLEGGPLVVLDVEGLPVGGTLVCSLFTASGPVAASAHGIGVLYLPPTLVTFDGSGPVSLCTSVVYDDGDTVYWNPGTDPEAGSPWSTDPTACGSIVIG